MNHPKIQFANRVLSILESQEDWDSGTTDDIAAAAFELGLADTSNSTGLFKDLQKPDHHFSTDPAFDYWGENPAHPLELWIEEATGENTRLGYWDWVQGRIESGDFDDESNVGDDLCDQGMRSGVVVDHTDENGDTVCVECASHDEPVSLLEDELVTAPPAVVNALNHAVIDPQK